MEDLSLDVGTTLNLELIAPPANPRGDVELIGYRRGHSLMVTMPDKHTASYLYQGCECVVRLFHGTRAAGFRSSVLHLATYPYRYLHLRYPQSVDQVQVRRAERVKTHLPAKLVPAGGAATVAAAVMDLSVTGALVLAHKPAGAVGDLVRLEFTVNFSGAEHALNIDAVIRNIGRRISDEADAGGYFGLEFTDPSNEQKIILNGFVYACLARRG